MPTEADLGPNSGFDPRSRYGRKPAARAGTGKTAVPDGESVVSKSGKARISRVFRHLAAARHAPIRAESFPSMTFPASPFSAPFGKKHQKRQRSRRRKSLPPKELGNEIAGARTRDLRIKSPLLYQLSYDLLKTNGVTLCRRKYPAVSLKGCPPVRRFSLSDIPRLPIILIGFELASSTSQPNPKVSFPRTPRRRRAFLGQ